jgi:hypothetical protein
MRVTCKLGKSDKHACARNSHLTHKDSVSP